MLGDTPESLRDLAVSLANLGSVYEQALQRDQASDCYHEGLLIGERLVNMLPDLPAYAEIKPFFQSRLAANLNPDEILNPPSALTARLTHYWNKLKRLFR